MNILLINHYAGSPQYGMEFRPYYMGREWQRMGHEVKILAGSYSHIRSKQPEMSSGKHKDEIIDGISYRWYKTTVYTGNGIKRVLSMLVFLRHLKRDAKKIAQEFKPDLVIASSTYPMDIWPARRIAKLSKAKLVYEVHDLWPLSPIQLGNLPRWHPFIIWVQMAEDYAYRHADKVVSMLPKTLEYMQSRGLAPKKFVYVPNGINLDEWKKPESLNNEVLQIIKNLKKKKQPIVGYVGTHGLANALDTLLDAMKILRGRVQLLSVGTGPEKEKLIKRVKDEEISNVIILPSIPKKEVPNLLQLIDIAYIGLKPEALFQYGISPNKLMDYMVSEKPIVCAIKAGNDPVGEAGCGITVPPGDAQLVADAIVKLSKLSPTQRKTMGTKGKSFILKNQTYPVLAKRFLAAMDGEL
ncbi:MAG TPA: glycosyltransferase family 4 protein [Turneriella sp.]|nr:glycosyltransferase family 4 protein [Turneriella sp.]